MHALRAIATVAALGISASAPVHAAEGDARIFDFVSLSAPERAREQRAADLDGDGLLDLVWVFESPDTPDDYGLRGCFQGSEPRFSQCADFDLGGDVRAFDIGEIDGQPGAEVVLLTRTGARVLNVDGGEFREGAELPRLQSLFAATDDEAPLAFRFLFDLNEDGRSEALLGTRRGVSLHRFASEGSPQLLESSPHVAYARRNHEVDLATFLNRDFAPHVSTQITAPSIFVEDFDGDGRRDIVTISDKRVSVFLQDAAGAFSNEPAKRIERSVLTQEEEDDGFAGEAITFADLNGDGPADLILLKWGSTEDRTRMDRHIYYAQPGLRFPDRADQVVRSESFFPNFEMLDLNGDGRNDLVVPYFHFAPSQAFKVVTQNALRVQLRLFLMGESGRYAQDPGKTFAKVDRRIVLDYHVDVMGMMFGARRSGGRFDPLLSLRGDFNGDGFADLVADSGDDRLHFYWGNAAANYAKSPDLAVEFESAMNSDLLDLNGDGKTDILTSYGRESLRWTSSTELQKYERTKHERKKAREARERQATTSGGVPPEARIKILLSK